MEILNRLAPLRIQNSERSDLLSKSGKNVFQASSPLLNKRSMVALFEQHCFNESAAVEVASASLLESAWAAASFGVAPDSLAQVCSFASFADYLNELSLKAYSLPASGVFTSGFGPRWSRHHSGIDIANHIGTAIHASRFGRVVFAEYLGAYGLMVEIQHPDGYRTRYAHCDEVLVRVGETVIRGDVIAKMGNTGRSTGPHLHFEIRNPKGIALDPEIFLGKINVQNHV